MGAVRKTLPQSPKLKALPLDTEIEVDLLLSPWAVGRCMPMECPAYKVVRVEPAEAKRFGAEIRL